MLQYLWLRSRVGHGTVAHLQQNQQGLQPNVVCVDLLGQIRGSGYHVSQQQGILLPCLRGLHITVQAGRRPHLASITHYQCQRKTQLCQDAFRPRVRPQRVTTARKRSRCIVAASSPCRSCRWARPGGPGATWTSLSRGCPGGRGMGSSEADEPSVRSIALAEQRPSGCFQVLRHILLATSVSSPSCAPVALDAGGRSSRSSSRSITLDESRCPMQPARGRLDLC